MPVLHDALSSENVAANVRDLSPPQSPLCGRVEAWGEGKEIARETYSITSFV